MGTLGVARALSFPPAASVGKQTLHNFDCISVSYAKQQQQQQQQ